MFRGVWDGVHPVAVKRFKGAFLEGRVDISNELEVLKLCRCVGLPAGCLQLCGNMQLWQETLRTPLNHAVHMRGVWDGVHPVAVKRFKGAFLEGRVDISNELEVLKLCRCVGLPAGCLQLCGNMQLWQETLQTPLNHAVHMCGAVCCKTLLL